jgi:transposase-like protein
VIDNTKCKCFMCSELMPVRSGMEMRMGGKKRFVCENCRLTICRPLPKSVDKPPVQ